MIFALSPLVMLSHRFETGSALEHPVVFFADSLHG